MTSTAICLGFRNWYTDHLWKCLQRLEHSPYPVYLIDYGSRDDVWKAVREIAEWHGVTLVREIPMFAPEWSRARALNRAAHAVSLKSGRVHTLIFTDVDMLFPAEWFSICEAMLDTPAGRETIWLTDSRDMSEMWSRDSETWQNDAMLFANTIPHDRVGQGAAMVVPAAWFNRVGGFDETYTVWGCEDNDLVLRAQWDGLPVEWLPEAWVAHQWHRRDWPTRTQLAQVQKNRAYLAERIVERGPVARNHPLLKGVLQT